LGHGEGVVASAQTRKNMRGKKRDEKREGEMSPLMSLTLEKREKEREREIEVQE
jgi:hypothetical protein